MHPLLSIAPLLVPLILGTISMVVWLGVRNESLSNRIRKAVDELLSDNLQKPLNSVHKSSLQSQLLLFVPRYEQNTLAMCLAIGSLVAVGGIAAVLLCLAIQPFNFSSFVIAAFLILGAGLMAKAIYISIVEIRNGRETLYHHVAACLELVPVVDSTEQATLLNPVLDIIGGCVPTSRIKRIP